MSYLRPTFSAKDYCNNIKPKGAIFYIMNCEKIAGGSQQLLFFGIRNRLFGRAKTFICFCPHLDKDNAPIGIDHNKVNFTTPAGKATGEFLKTFLFKKDLAAPLAPLAELLSISQQLASVQQPAHY
jgi:hypothetical protein